MADFNTMELMICTAARELEDGATVGVGTGAPCAAAMLSQKTTAPNLVIFFEAGGVAPLIPVMPISVGDSRTTWKANMAAGMCEVMETCCRGFVDYTFLGGAQIDMYGNLNSTRIGGRPAETEGKASRQRRRQRFRVLLLENDGHHGAGRPAFRGKMRVHHHSRLSHGGRFAA